MLVDTTANEEEEELGSVIQIPTIHHSSNLFDTNDVVTRVENPHVGVKFILVSQLISFLLQLQPDRFYFHFTGFVLFLCSNFALFSTF
ncbi:hypothetical protein HanIR_Chr10g0451861 [Helianthus annuus]|nr:hypothetical protein HanIR_Chr10g0451861 [Helianthus annuus]